MYGSLFIFVMSLQEDPALTRWTYARTNVYPHFRPTAKTSLLGALFGVVPLFFWFAVFKTDRVSVFNYVYVYDVKLPRLRSGCREYRLMRLCISIFSSCLLFCHSTLYWDSITCLYSYFAFLKLSKNLIKTGIKWTKVNHSTVLCICVMLLFGNIYVPQFYMNTAAFLTSDTAVKHVCQCAVYLCEIIWCHHFNLKAVHYSQDKREEQIKAGTYDRKYKISYWSKLLRSRRVS